MKPKFTFSKSSFKHGIREDDIRYALGIYQFEGAILKDEDIIGFDRNGNLLEVIYSMTDENAGNVSHTMKCRKRYLELI